MSSSLFLVNTLTICKVNSSSNVDARFVVMVMLSENGKSKVDLHCNTQVLSA